MCRILGFCLTRIDKAESDGRPGRSAETALRRSATRSFPGTLSSRDEACCLFAREKPYGENR